MLIRVIISKLFCKRLSLLDVIYEVSNVLAKPVAMSQSQEEISWKDYLKVIIKWISGITAAHRVDISKFLNYPFVLVCAASTLPIPQRKKCEFTPLVYTVDIYIIICMYTVTVCHTIRVTYTFFHALSFLARDDPNSLIPQAAKPGLIGFCCLHAHVLQHVNSTFLFISFSEQEY